MTRSFKDKQWTLMDKGHNKKKGLFFEFKENCRVWILYV